MKLLQQMKLLQLIFLSFENNKLARKINLQKFAILGKVWHFAPPIPFSVVAKMIEPVSAIYDDPALRNQRPLQRQLPRRRRAVVLT
jgi:hypothetical protein